ncbi:MAG: hypothetical protein BGO96_09180 [Micrococcales bacterium 73-15]|uniref:hypothetical protein n=1 Tax=Salana multivorans TaxID=120377 RepID=UPI00096303E2|nr:hypothetical protein [Salana multivorans]OJX93986.1 MAG: hypothetical protein BGO96_09180 [Micrococcales bacterium 73-15]
MSFTVTAPIETIPPSHHDKAPDRQTRDLVATAETYEEARDMVRAQVPEGWRIMYYLVAND